MTGVSVNPNRGTTSHWESRALRVGLGCWDPVVPWGTYVQAVMNAEDRKFTSIRNTPAIPADAEFRADRRQVEELSSGHTGDRGWVYRLFARWVLGETINPAQRSSVESVIGAGINWKAQDRLAEWREKT
jgi:hypothetical protein